jgi:hypothetical protein
MRARISSAVKSAQMKSRRRIVASYAAAMAGVSAGSGAYVEP